MSAYLSEFIRVRAGIPSGEVGDLQAHYCADCNFSFISKAYTDVEAERIYHDYRGTSYNAQRVELEPSYAGLISQFEDRSSPYFTARIGVLANVFREYSGHFTEGASRTILDFGSSDPYIVEEALKRAGLSSGQIRCFDIGQSIAEIDFGGISCVIVNHVLEHLSTFNLFGDLIKRVMASVPIYIELPLEYGGELDLAFRVCAQAPSPCALNVAHEHINQFSREAVKALALSSWMSVDETTIRPSGGGFVLSCLGRRIGPELDEAMFHAAMAWRGVRDRICKRLYETWHRTKKS
jgi:hypothetical protein